METFVRNLRRRHSKRTKRQKELKLLKNVPKSPSLCLSISKLVIRKKNNKKAKRIREQYPGSLINGSCEGHFSLNANCEENFTEYGQCEEDIFEQTIDLSDSETESSVFSSRSSVLVVPSFEVQRKDDVIDLSKDLPDQNEIIDLTETVNMAEAYCHVKGSLEPTVIDISEENSQDQPSCVDPSTKLNDEIFVLGSFNKNISLTEKCKTPSSIPLSNKWNNFDNLISCSEKLKKKYLMKQLILDKIGNKNVNLFKKGLTEPMNNLTKVEENIYVNSPVTFPSNGLRPIIIDGSNVAFVHSNCNFSCKRLEICINYFKEKGHKVTAFVPQYRINSHRSDDPQLLKRLEKQGDVILTPSKKVDGINIVPYDDRFIVQTAVLKGGIIVSRDNYNDLLKENPAWADTIKYRTLAFTWVDDVLMFPKDPLGEYGPSLEEFLRFH